MCYRLACLCLLICSSLASAPILTAQPHPYNGLEPAHLPFLKKSKLIQISSHDTTGGNNDRINIHAGKTVTIADVTGPGIITRIWITIDSRDPHFLRRIVMRIYWDGEENPSVEVPVGDFFGTGFEYVHHFSAFNGMTSGGYFSYFHMPFQNSARIEIENETGEEIFAFYYHVNIQKLETPLPDDAAYFHAQWNRELRTDPGQNYLILDARGEGHFIGLNMSMQGYRRGLGYLEGDEMVYVDGESYPSVYGTGTEDYFTSGWYFNNGPFHSPLHGLVVKNDSLGRIAAYRYHVGDVIPFKRSIRFTMEHGHGNEAICDYSSTAFWYQKEPHQPFPSLPAANLRIPLRIQIPNGLIEGEGLTNAVDVSARAMEMTGFGPEWSGLEQLLIPAAGPGLKATLAIPAGNDDVYNVFMYYTRGPEYGNALVSAPAGTLNRSQSVQMGRSVATLQGYDTETLPSGCLGLLNVPVTEGKLYLEFETIKKDSLAAGHAIGIDGFMLEPVRTYIPQWMMIGPFPNPRDSDILRYGLDTVYPPEIEVNYRKTYAGVNNQRIRWGLIQTPESGYLSLTNQYDPYEMVIAYAATSVYSPIMQTLPLLLGSDDGSKVFLNGEELYRFLAVRVAGPDQVKIMLPLKRGWNSLLLKLENNFGGYGFYARIRDPKQTIITDVDKKK